MTRQHKVDWDVVADAVNDAIGNNDGRVGALSLERAFKDADLVVRHAMNIGDKALYSAGSYYNRAPCTITGFGHKDGRAVYDNSLGAWGYRDQYELVP